MWVVAERKERQLVAIVLALSAAAAYGSADFVGGLASRKTPPVAVAFGAQVGGLGLLLLALPFLGGGGPQPRDLMMGAVAGLFGGVGLMGLYRSLSLGPMSIVAPVTALSASLVPIFAGLLLGERPGPVSYLAIGVSLLAVTLITREPGSAEHSARPTRSVILMALGSGSLFGLFFVFLHQAGPEARLWPLVGARMVSIPLLFVLAHRQAVAREWTTASTLRSVVVSGGLDMAANILYLLAVQQGMLSVVAAIIGLYPAATVLLAQSHLDERLAKSQMAGLGTAATAAVLMAIA